MKPVIFLTHDLFDLFQKDLNTISENQFNWIRINFDNLENNTNFFKYLEKVRVIVSRKDLSEVYYNQAKKLQLIQLPISGYDQVDLKKAKRMGIQVCNTSGANAISVAEHFFSLILGNFRNLIHHHTTVVNGDWINLKNYNEELYGKTIGIVGLGNIGMEVAKRALAFGMKVIFNDIKKTKKIKLHKTEIYNCNLTELLNEADIVSFHVPLTIKTRKMINSDLLSKMKKNAVLVNLARGEIQIEDDIVNALKKNIISRVILDVYSQEPFPSKSSLIKFGRQVALNKSDKLSKKQFVQSSKAIFSPHSGPSKETRQRAIKFIINNIMRLNSGLKLKSLCIDYD